MSENIIQKFRRLSNDITKNILPGASKTKRMLITLDFLWEKFRYDIELIDYVQYQFYYKKRADRNRFITHGKLVYIIKICNDPQSRPIFDKKPLFDKEFQRYLGRDFLYMPDSTRSEFNTFLDEHEYVFSKCPDGMFGQGLEKFKVKDIKDVDEFYKRCCDNSILLEEVLTQHSVLAEFNNTAVNTLRVVTLVCADNSVKVMAGVLRLSRKGKVADNFHHHGLAALIDVDTGIVFTTAVDREWKRYILHPDSGKKIVGFEIPYWEKVVEVVKEAATVHPEVRYVGWDVTIKADGQVVLIEGNPGADPDVTQIEDQVGKWPLYEPYVNQIKALKN